MKLFVKRGTTFRAALVDFTAETWAEIYPNTSITAEARNGSTYEPLTVTMNAAAREIHLIATDTSDWALGDWAFDLVVVKDGLRSALPGAANIPFTVIQGVTR